METLIDENGECLDVEMYSLVAQQKQELKNKKSSLKTSIKQFTIQLNDLDSKINGIESRITNIEDKKCPICYMDVEQPCITPCCRNVFCLECLTMAVTTSSRKECPLCRSKIDMKKVNIIVTESENKPKDVTELPTKMERLIEIS